jgi:hypothetical protein
VSRRAAGAGAAGRTADHTHGSVLRRVIGPALAGVWCLAYLVENHPARRGRLWVLIAVDECHSDKVVTAAGR